MDKFIECTRCGVPFYDRGRGKVSYFFKLKDGHYLCPPCINQMYKNEKVQHGSAK